jgi:hypothetical protein
MLIADLLEQPPFATSRPEKVKMLLAGLVELTEHHRRGSDTYRRMVDAVFGSTAAVPVSLAGIPWLPVRLFKRMDLVSVPRERIVKQLVSSGTTGQAVSRIYLDSETAGLQTRALSKIAGEFLGRQRLPMVIVDDNSFLGNRAIFSARAAGIVGFSTFGRDHFYLLDKDLEPDWDGLKLHLAKHSSSPILLFGFTFIVWQQFVERARRAGLKMPFPRGSILVHGGGWKRLADRQIGNDSFKAAIAETFGITRVHNYYGMVEQVGSVFFECEAGYLHPPAFADLLIRNPMTFEVVPNGVQGLIQVLSLLPRSYPGHSLVTEDLGTIHGEDDCPCGRSGKRFTVSGRLKDVEIRGCSDTRVLSTS